MRVEYSGIHCLVSSVNIGGYDDETFTLMLNSTV